VLIYEPITSIGENAFKDCTMLNNIECHASVAPSLGTGAFDNISPTGVLKVPAGSDYSS
jgi:hypothetical protein